MPCAHNGGVNTAPALSESTRTGGERDALVGLVAQNRLELRRLLDGITGEQARARLVPSLTTLLGLVKHGVYVERVWFQVHLGRRTRAEVGIAETIDESMTLTSEDTIDAVVADFDRACAESDVILARHDLGDTLEHPRMGTLSIRWVLGHLIEEYARHAGHGDILREQLLAREDDGRAAEI